MSESTRRLVSLDAFRGLSVAGMILVNNPGSWNHVYPPMLHAEWHGWTPTDLIFPFFLFIVGVSMAFSVAPRLESGADRAMVVKKIIKRSLIIIALGLFLAGFPRFNISTLRFPGVLQRIGLVYLCAGVLVAYLSRRGIVMLTVGLLLGYWALMTLVPVPGFGAGDLSPEGNLAAFIDRTVFGTHIWREMWDPEGLLSTLPAIATTLTGVMTGWWMRTGRDKREIAGWMFVAGWMAVIAGLAWGAVFPINKNLWTSSYVIFTSGAALEALAVCYWLIDVEGRKRWAQPAVAFGMNAITVFVLSGLLAKILLITHAGPDGATTCTWVYRSLFVPIAGELNGSLAFAVTTLALWLSVAWLMLRRHIFIKV